MFVLLGNISVRIGLYLFAGILAAFGITKALPETVQIHVPFTTQAPRGVWSEPWQNACEEASILMIDTFYNGDMLTKEKAHDEILNIFAVKERAVGQSSDESMETIAAIINASDLIWQARVVDNPKLADMKAELSDQRPIIAPVYAPALNNPHFRDGGPDYHVVVITGYDDTTSEFITHDPGTEQGENFRYGYVEFLSSIHDFLSVADYTAGPQRVLFTYPKND